VTGVPTDESVSIHIKNTWNTENRDGQGGEYAQTVLNMMTQYPVCDVSFRKQSPRCCLISS
jgi:hypothetical protein